MHFEADYKSLLTSREQKCLKDAKAEYEQIYETPPEADRDLVVYLGDNFNNRKTWSGTSRTCFFSRCAFWIVQPNMFQSRFAAMRRKNSVSVTQIAGGFRPSEPGADCFGGSRSSGG